jgi:hypothetical protein
MMPASDDIPIASRISRGQIAEEKIDGRRGPGAV